MDPDKIVDIGIISVILIVIFLKIINVITISWLWLLSPLWISLGVGCLLGTSFLILLVLQGVFKK
jgi:hypothetical protein